MSAGMLPGVDETSVDRACPTCGSRGLVDALHPVRCAYSHALADDVQTRAAAHGIPATPARDLFGHLLELREDGTLAHRAALLVIDLGWRPVVGSEFAQLWQRRDDPYCVAQPEEAEDQS